MLRAFLLVAILLARPSFAADKQFIDPAPPAVANELAKPISAALPNPDARFHAAPKALSPDAKVHDWASFLGPTHNAVSTETNLLDDLSRLKIVWEVTRGSGYAAPAISGQALVLFHRVGNQEVVDCLHRETGQRFWRHAYPTTYTDRYGYSDGPRASPVILREKEGGRVFTHGAEGKLHCLDLLAGQVLWQRELMKEFKIDKNFFGVGATPLIEGNLLILNLGAPGGPCVAAFDCTTGRMIWGADDQWGASYSSPVSATIHGQRRILVFAGGESDPPSGGLLCIDPANGHVDFAHSHRGKRRESVNASSPLVFDNDKVFISECYGAGGVCLQITPDFKPKILWQTDRLGTHFMTALYKDGHIYGFHGHGPLDCPLVCLNAKTGEVVWSEEPRWVEQFQTKQGPRQLRLGLNRSQLLDVDGRTLCLTENGHLLWLDLNPKGYKETSRTSLFLATETWTPPVLSRGLLYINQNSNDMLRQTPPRMICYDLRGR